MMNAETDVTEISSQYASRESPYGIIKQYVGVKVCYATEALRCMTFGLIRISYEQIGCFVKR